MSLAPPSAQKLVVIRAAGRGVVSQTASSAVADTSSWWRVSREEMEVLASRYSRQLTVNAYT